MYRTQLRDEPKHTFDDNLHAAGRDGNVRGEWHDRTVRPSLYTHAVLQPAVFGLVALGVAAIAVDTLRQRR